MQNLAADITASVRMGPSEFKSVLRELGWSKQKLCARLGLHRNTPRGWTDGPPRYVAEYLRVVVLAGKILAG